MDEPGPSTAGQWAHVVECPICYSVYDKPMQMGCGHTLCSSCIGRLVDQVKANMGLGGNGGNGNGGARQADEQGAFPPGAGVDFLEDQQFIEIPAMDQRDPQFVRGIVAFPRRRAPGIEIKCPECRKPTVVPADGLPVNYRVQEIVQKVAHLFKDRHLVKHCTQCEEILVQGVYFDCAQCENHKICSTCAIRSHNGHPIVEKKALTAKDVLQMKEKICDAAQTAYQAHEDMKPKLQAVGGTVESKMNNYLTKVIGIFDLMCNTFDSKIKETTTADELQLEVKKAEEYARVFKEAVESVNNQLLPAIENAVTEFWRPFELVKNDMETKMEAAGIPIPGRRQPTPQAPAAQQQQVAQPPAQAAQPAAVGNVRAIFNQPNALIRNGAGQQQAALHFAQVNRQRQRQRQQGQIQPHVAMQQQQQPPVWRGPAMQQRGMMPPHMPPQMHPGNQQGGHPGMHPFQMQIHMQPGPQQQMGPPQMPMPMQGMPMNPQQRPNPHNQQHQQNMQNMREQQQLHDLMLNGHVPLPPQMPPGPQMVPPPPQMAPMPPRMPPQQQPPPMRRDYHFVPPQHQQGFYQQAHQMQRQGQQVAPQGQDMQGPMQEPMQGQMQVPIHGPMPVPGQMQGVVQRPMQGVPQGQQGPIHGPMQGQMQGPMRGPMPGPMPVPIPGAMEAPFRAMQAQIQAQMQAQMQEAMQAQQGVMNGNLDGLQAQHEAMQARQGAVPAPQAPMRIQAGPVQHALMPPPQRQINQQVQMQEQQGGQIEDQQEDIQQEDQIQAQQNPLPVQQQDAEQLQQLPIQVQIAQEMIARELAEEPEDIRQAVGWRQNEPPANGGEEFPFANEAQVNGNQQQGGVQGEVAERRRRMNALGAFHEANANIQHYRDVREGIQLDGLHVDNIPHEGRDRDFGRELPPRIREINENAAAGVDDDELPVGVDHHVFNDMAVAARFARFHEMRQEVDAIADEDYIPEEAEIAVRLEEQEVGIPMNNNVAALNAGVEVVNVARAEPVEQPIAVDQLENGEIVDGGEPEETPANEQPTIRRSQRRDENSTSPTDVPAETRRTTRSVTRQLSVNDEATTSSGARDRTPSPGTVPKRRKVERRQASIADEPEPMEQEEPEEQVDIPRVAKRRAPSSSGTPVSTSSGPTTRSQARS